MPNETVTKTILAFVKKLDSGEDDETLIRTAIARNWLDHDGNPTVSGRELVRSFDELDAVTSRYH